jgi:hypothetical protein
MRMFGVLLLLLAMVLFAVFDPPDRRTAAPEPGHGAAEAWVSPVEPPPDPGHLTAITGRPLFQPERHPPVADPVQEPVPDPPRVRLSAVSISRDVRVAVVKELDSGRTRRVQEGEKLNQWTIKHVHPTRIVLEWHQKETVIPLFSGE